MTEETAAAITTVTTTETKTVEVTVPSTITIPNKLKVNREKTCPFLLRVFVREGSFHRLDEFNGGEKLPIDELQIYTWKDATLRELTNLISQVHPLTHTRHTLFSFQLVYHDVNLGRITSRHLGTVSNLPSSSSSSLADDTLTLEQLNFVIGDYLDVKIAFSPPGSSSSAAAAANSAGNPNTSNRSNRRPPPSGGGGGGGSGGRYRSGPDHWEPRTRSRPYPPPTSGGGGGGGGGGNREYHGGGESQRGLESRNRGSR